jgi:hypothetical protein
MFVSDHDLADDVPGRAEHLDSGRGLRHGHHQLQQLAHRSLSAVGHLRNGDCNDFTQPADFAEHGRGRKELLNERPLEATVWQPEVVPHPLLFRRSLYSAESR